MDSRLATMTGPITCPIVNDVGPGNQLASWLLDLNVLSTAYGHPKKQQQQNNNSEANAHFKIIFI